MENLKKKKKKKNGRKDGRLHESNDSLYEEARVSIQKTIKDFEISEPKLQNNNKEHNDTIVI